MDILKDRNIKTAVLVLALVAVSYLVDARKALADEADIAQVRQTIELNPQNPADAQLLLERIRATTRKACGNTSLEQAQYRLECLQMSYANAVATFNNSHGIDLEAVAADTAKLTVASE